MPNNRKQRTMTEKTEEEKKTESNQEYLSVGSSHLPRYFLPPFITKFCDRDAEAEPFKSDDDYFNAILACETARLITYRLRTTLCTEVYSTSTDSFALPSSLFFTNGEHLSRTLENVTRELDKKRSTMVLAMKDRPLIEKFLDNMDASDAERNIFRYVLIAASGIQAITGTEYDRYTRDLSLLDPYGTTRNRYSASTLDIQAICQHELSLAELLSLTDIQSTWVKEQIFDRCIRPTDHISAMNSVTVRVLSGVPITVEQYQKLESTVLQDTLLEHEPFKQTETGKVVVEKQGMAAAFHEKEDVDEFTSDVAEDPFSNELAEALADAEKKEGKRKLYDIISALQQEEEALIANTEPLITPEREDSQHDQAKDTDFAPYKSEMDYLEDQIRMMDLQTNIKSLKADLENDTEDSNPLHYSAARLRRDYDPALSKEDNKLQLSRQASKLESKLKKLKEKIAIRLGATKKERSKTPRLEQLCDALKLEQFEKFVLLDLIRVIVNPFHYDMDREDGQPSGCVATYIERFTSSLEEKMSCRKYFYKSSTLVGEGIITISTVDFQSDLNQCSVSLDRRMFDYIIGLDTEFSELVDGSHLYTPEESLDDVILPKETKDRICEAVLEFSSVKDAYHSLEIDKKITYGLGQVILFYGISGTGKTMMANALAAKLKKKILLVNFPNLGMNTSGELVKFLFREARIKKAIIFFDECESLFASRDTGNYSINTVLSELERFDDLCIMATNRPCDLDEAMYRRVSLAIQFMKPDHLLREQIWKTLRPPQLKVDEDVNYRELARKYELTGGLIKNAWLGSVSIMTHRGGDKATHADLEQAASEQVVGRLSNEDFDRRVVPTCGIEAVVSSSEVAESLKNIVQHSKAQSVLFGQWGFGKKHRTPPGVSALFYGISGTGKTMAAEAISYDLGRPLMAVNTAELVDKYVGETGKNIESVFLEAKQKEAVLVFDEGEGLFGTRQQQGDSVSRHDTINVGLLLKHMENFSGVCIVVTNQKDAIDEAFFRRFRHVLHFEPPTTQQRVKLWESIVPPECPLANDVSFELLANKYEMCGGNIKSSILRAATRAALRLDEEDCIVSMADLEQACEEELSKDSGKNKHNEIYA